MVKLFNKILETLAQNNSCVLATAVSSRGSSPRKIGAKMIVYKDASIEGTIGGGKLEKTVIADALDALKRKKSFLKTYLLDRKSGLQVCGGEVSIFLEVLEPDKKIIIAGAGHIGLALSLITKLLGFEVVIADNRRAFASASRFPHADRLICAPYKEAFKKTPIDKNTFIVIVTHGHAFDMESLEAALKTGAGYIGMIGSDAKIKLVFSALAKKGFKKSELKCVHTPVGLDIGAETPEEIAVAIAAELVAVVRA
ncbi:MAG: XdhC/CoxI family protein [Candidatus Omnitrophota bacterium]